MTEVDSSHREPIGVAIIGLGTVGRRFIEQFQKHPAYDVIGGADTNAAARDAAHRDFGVQIVESDALISDERVELAYVAVPPLHHESLVDTAILAGKAVFCEKPLGVDNNATADLVQRVESSGVPAAVNFVFGGAPGAQQLIAETAGLNGPLSADLRLHFCRWPRDWQAGATWLRDLDQGGWIREVVSHYVFLMLRAFGHPEIVSAWVAFPADGSSEQSLTATLQCGDAVVRVSASSDAAGADEVEFTVRGTERALRLTNWYELSAAEADGPWTAALDPAHTGGPAAYRSLLDQLAAVCRGETHTLATFGEAYTVQRIVEELIERGS